MLERTQPMPAAVFQKSVVQLRKIVRNRHRHPVVAAKVSHFAFDAARASETATRPS